MDNIPALLEGLRPRSTKDPHIFPPSEGFNGKSGTLIFDSYDTETRQLERLAPAPLGNIWDLLAYDGPMLERKGLESDLSYRYENPFKHRIMVTGITLKPGEKLKLREKNNICLILTGCLSFTEISRLIRSKKNLGGTQGQCVAGPFSRRVVVESGKAESATLLLISFSGEFTSSNHGLIFSLPDILRKASDNREPGIITTAASCKTWLTGPESGNLLLGQAPVAIGLYYSNHSLVEVNQNRHRWGSQAWIPLPTEEYSPQAMTFHSGVHPKFRGVTEHPYYSAVTTDGPNNKIIPGGTVGLLLHLYPSDKTYLKTESEKPEETMLALLREAKAKGYPIYTD